jgi:hypothetical protein
MFTEPLSSVSSHCVATRAKTLTNRLHRPHLLHLPLPPFAHVARHNLSGAVAAGFVPSCTPPSERTLTLASQSLLLSLAAGELAVAVPLLSPAGASHHMTARPPRAAPSSVLPNFHLYAR